MPTINEIENYFSKEGIPEEPCYLDICTKINYPKRFVKGHIAMLRANTGNKRFLPYFERLNKYYEHVKKTREGIIYSK